MADLSIQKISNVMQCVNILRKLTDGRERVLLERSDLIDAAPASSEVSNVADLVDPTKVEATSE